MLSPYHCFENKENLNNRFLLIFVIVFTLLLLTTKMLKSDVTSI